MQFVPDTPVLNALHLLWLPAVAMRTPSNERPFAFEVQNDKMFLYDTEPACRVFVQHHCRQQWVLQRACWPRRGLAWSIITGHSNRLFKTGGSCRQCSSQVVARS